MACSPAAAPVAAHYDDPFAYCPAVGTIDTLDVRYTGSIPRRGRAGFDESYGLASGCFCRGSCAAPVLEVHGLQSVRLHGWREHSMPGKGRQEKDAQHSDVRLLPTEPCSRGHSCGRHQVHYGLRYTMELRERYGTGWQAIDPV